MRRLMSLMSKVRPGSMVPRQAQGGEARVLVVNSGNANAFTGKVGQEGVREAAAEAAAVAGMPS